MFVTKDWLNCLLLLLSFVYLVNGGRKRIKIPLIDDYQPRIHQGHLPPQVKSDSPSRLAGGAAGPSSSSSSSKSCHFGNKTYQPEDKWKPNLGPPFGLLPCVLCQCVSLQKKSRTVARVRCRNIVSQCPKPDCPEPILLPGRCCKLCPDNESMEIDDDLVPLMDIDGETLCENWRAVPRVYRKLIRKGKICSGTTTTTTTTSTTTASTKEIDGEDASSKDRNETKQIDKMVPTSNQNSNLMEDDSNDIHSTGVRPDRCLYEDKFFDDGSQWKSLQDECKMCSCQRGRVKCEQIICPVATCMNPVTLSGDCCPVCLENDISLNESQPLRGCFFEGDQKFHMAGTKWHPYIPPFGFDKCSLCSCLPETLTIQCKRSVTCPALTCSHEEAYRENALDCCKRCPNTVQVKSIDTEDELGDQSVGPRLRHANELISAGGCNFNDRIYPNGDEWHPYVAPFGEMRCVKCHCKNGKIRCNRIKCPAVGCLNPVVPVDKCCPVCLEPPN